MFFPIRTDRRLNATPWVNYALIVLNVGIFIATRPQIQAMTHDQNQLRYIEQRLWELDQRSRSSPGIMDAINLRLEATKLQNRHAALMQQLQSYPLRSYFLQPTDTKLYQYLSYQFLHNGLMHLVGNMIFLFIFGNGVEDRLGKIGYLFFYLAGGILAGIGHLGSSEAPVLGASGAVAAVTGAYLALFPLSNVTIVYWFVIIGAFEVSSMVLILFRVGQDAIFQLLDVGNVAYMAHLAGYLFGFVIGMGLLLGRMLTREPYDMLALIEQRRRRAQFKKMTRRDGFQPWESGKPGAAEESPVHAKPSTPEETALMERRAKISAALADHDVPAAARRYVELIEAHPHQVMGQQQQLDIANQLMAEGWYDQAAAAYEAFLGTYQAYPDKHQIQLILGLIHARYLDQPDRAKALLNQAIPRLEADEKQLAEAALAELDARP